MLNAKCLVLFKNASNLNRNSKLIGSLFKYSTNNNNKKPLINISDSCVEKLKTVKEPNKYLRVSVEAGGCSGFEYKFTLDSVVNNSEDLFIERDNCKIIVDKETLNYIKGATIDYYEELIRSGFRVINNPSAEQGCSCGSSFSIKI